MPSPTFSVISARTLGNASWLTSMMSPSSLPPSVCCILFVVSGTTLRIARHTRLRLNVGKTANLERRWPYPDGLGELSSATRVWFGDPALEPSSRGILLLAALIANGLQLWGGSQIAVDTTLVSPLTSAGVPRRLRGSTAGAALAEARRAKERTYPEFADARRSRLVVLGLEAGGRWSAEAATFIRLLARARARSAAVSQRAACVRL